MAPFSAYSLTDSMGMRNRSGALFEAICVASFGMYESIVANDVDTVMPGLFCSKRSIASSVSTARSSLPHHWKVSSTSPSSPPPAPLEHDASTTASAIAVVTPKTRGNRRGTILVIAALLVEACSDHGITAREIGFRET